MALAVSLQTRTLPGIAGFCTAIAAVSIGLWSAEIARALGTDTGITRTSSAIADLRDGGYELLELPPSPSALASGRVLAGDGSTRALRLAVVLLRFEDGPGEPFSAASVARTLFEAKSSVAKLYAEQSFGILRMSGDVFGWIRAPRGETPCDFNAWAESAAAALGRDVLGAYTNLLVVVPASDDCEWSGLAYVSGTTAWINGEPSARSVGHEIGHNLGLGHASSLSCKGPGGRVSLSAECEKADEYGDPFTLMGSGGTLHVNGIHKTQLGWLAPTNVVDVTRSGTYQLAPLGTTSALPQLLRISRGASALVVDYRQPVAVFERFGGPFEPRGGVTARLTSGSGAHRQSLLIDASPATSTYADAILAVGRTLTDTATNIQLTTLAAEPDRALVDVVIPESDAAEAGVERPLAPTTLVSVATPGRKRTRVDIRWRPPARSIDVSRYLLLRNGRVVARTNALSATRFESHGRSVYSVVAVSASGIRGPQSPRLRISTAGKRAAKPMRIPIRGVEARPTSSGRLTLRLRRGISTPARIFHDRRTARLPANGRLSLPLSIGTTRALVRRLGGPASRPVKIVAVHRPPIQS